MTDYKKSIFIFRRDFRLEDNLGLVEALEKSKEVIPIFIFTPEQVRHNDFKSDNAVQFMVQSLEDLDSQLKRKDSKLFYFHGKPDKIIEKLLKRYDEIEAVFVNMDYTPYAKKRDQEINDVCSNNFVDFISTEDYLLNKVGSITTKSKNKIYTKFTPYFDRAKKFHVTRVKKNNLKNYRYKSTQLVGQYRGDIHKFYKSNNKVIVKGGRKEALKKLRDLKEFKDYNDTRNILHINTTRLSAFIKFGCVSIREVYYAFKNKLGKDNDLIKQLYWRDFYFNITYEYPRVLGDFDNNRNFSKEFSKIPWKTEKKASKKEKEYFEKWKKGETGYPAVDAPMREMNTTGFMHNRGRLIVASFLVKHLMWHWKEGEKYFARTLVDYDPSVNNGNWQWCSGSGVDSQPYFRIFNPWSQSKDYDEDCEYIKKWIPELKDVEPDHIHKWYDHFDDEEYEDIDYPEPIVEHSKARENALKKFKKALN